ncbi:GNAT family N-acetyltransferase [Nocardia shimofusensis]|uniref:GNAT family N-acetyltransferase n=1 Tax=Nocardia shimofusensis TaxID=228596 RepID=UPI0008347092|nr:GNAT family N-acetyltransferase [Nocardia shimofusensis]
MSDQAREITLTRNADKSRYEVFYGGEPAGFAEYEESGERTDFVHTEVGDAFGGKGLAGALAKYALDDAIARGKRIVATCPFIKGYIDKHPEYAPNLVG